MSYVVNITIDKEYDVFIGRPSKWSNPFSHLEVSTAQFKVVSRDEAIKKYEQWLLDQPELVADIKKYLKGKVLGCYCTVPAQRCHGEILLKIANE